jgi:hypothetical protein
LSLATVVMRWSCPFGKRACEENRAAVVSEHDIEAARNANGTR